MNSQEQKVRAEELRKRIKEGYYTHPQIMETIAVKILREFKKEAT